MADRDSDESELRRLLALVPAHELADTLRDVLAHIVDRAPEGDLRVIAAGIEGRDAPRH